MGEVSKSTAGWSEVFTLCLNNMHFSALNFVRLRSTSNAVRVLLIKQLTSGDRNIARMLLQREVANASTVTPDEQEQHTEAVQDLLRVADIPPALMELDTVNLVMVSLVSWQLKLLLTVAGTRPTYQQVVTAAKQGVKGCEEWILVHCAVCRHRGAPTDVSDTVEAVCAGDEVAAELQHDITSESLVGLLYIALNACSVRHAVSFKSLCKGPAAERLTTAAAAELLKAAVELLYNAETADRFMITYMTALSETPAARKMSPSEIFGVIQSTIYSKRQVICAQMDQRRMNNWCADFLLYQLPGAQQLPAADVCSLVRLALREFASAVTALKDYGNISDASGILEDCLGSLLDLPAAKCMDRADIDSLLEEAAQWEMYHSKTVRKRISVLSQLVPKPAVGAATVSDNVA